MFSKLKKDSAVTQTEMPKLKAQWSESSLFSSGEEQRLQLAPGINTEVAHLLVTASERATCGKLLRSSL